MCAVAAENFVANTVAVSAACVQMMLTDACVVDMCCCCMGVVALYVYIHYAFAFDVQYALAEAVCCFYYLDMCIGLGCTVHFTSCVGLECSCEGLGCNCVWQ